MNIVYPRQNDKIFWEDLHNSILIYIIFLISFMWFFIVPFYLNVLIKYFYRNQKWVSVVTDLAVYVYVFLLLNQLHTFCLTGTVFDEAARLLGNALEFFWLGKMGKMMSYSFVQDQFLSCKLGYHTDLFTQSVECVKEISRDNNL